MFFALAKNTTIVLHDTAFDLTLHDNGWTMVCTTSDLLWGVHPSNVENAPSDDDDIEPGETSPSLRQESVIWFLEEPYAQTLFVG